MLLVNHVKSDDSDDRIETFEVKGALGRVSEGKWYLPD